MSIRLKDVRFRVAQYFPVYFQSCFQKAYDMRALDLVVDVARVALARITELEKVIDAQKKDIMDLSSKLVLANVKAGERDVKPEPTTRFFVRLESIPGAKPANYGEIREPLPPGTNIIGMVKAIRAATNMGLKEAKDIVDYAREERGQTIGPFDAEKAADLHKELVTMGGKAFIQPGSKVAALPEVS